MNGINTQDSDQRGRKNYGNPGNKHFTKKIHLDLSLGKGPPIKS